MSASNVSNQKIRSLVFEKLSYDPVLDSDADLKVWIASHPSGALSPFINGVYVGVSEKQQASTKQVLNPSNGTLVAKVLECDQTLYNQAVEGSLKAAKAWKSLSKLERGRIIYNIARNIQKHLQKLVSSESITTGRSSRECKELDVTQAIKTFYHYAGSTDYIAGFNGESTYTALGVVAIVPHYDSPLLSIVSKLAPALATGNACLIVAASHMLSAFMLADVCAQSGLPSGVLNVISGADEPVVNWAAADTRLAALLFDGRLLRAQEVIRQSSLSASKQVFVSTEGKSSLVVYESADFDSAIETILDGCFYSNGQHRYSLNKVFIQESVYDDLVSRLEARFRKIKVGNHLDKCSDLAAMFNADDTKQLKEFMGSKLAESGAKVEQFNECLTDAKSTSLVAPALVKDLGLNSEFNLNEINGPYLILQKFRTVKESVELINNSKFASAVSLFSQDISLVLEVANLVNVGTVWVNSIHIEKGVQPRKQSGTYQISGQRCVRQFLRANWEPSYETTSSNREELDKILKQFGSLDASASAPLAKSVDVEQTYKLYIGGKQTRPDTQSSRPVYKHSGDGGDQKKEILCLVPDSSRKDVRNAVEAANSAFSSWSKRANFNKAQILYYFGENFESRGVDIAKKLEKVTGKSAEECLNEVKLCCDVIFHFAAICDKRVGKLNDPIDNGYTLESSDALGCIAIICGHDSSRQTNRPLLSLLTHLVGAIACGNTVVVVPDEHAPIPGLDLYEVLDTSDMPGGVVNLLSGDKRHLAKHLSEHQQVSAVWYLCDVGDDNNTDKAAVQFVKSTSAFSLKRTWFSTTRVPLDETASVRSLNALYLDDVVLNATQAKIIHCPMGTIFAN